MMVPHQSPLRLNYPCTVFGRVDHPDSCYNKGPHHFHDSSKLKDVKMKGIAWLFEVKLEGREGVATKCTIAT